MAERLHPKAVRHLLASFFELGTGCFHRHGGIVEKSLATRWSPSLASRLCTRTMHSGQCVPPWSCEKAWLS
jgi:hypothetical protein